MSDLTPISRERLQQMKAEQDEKDRQEKEKRRVKEVQRIIADVYSSVTWAAKSKAETSYTYAIVNYDEKEFLLDKGNMEDVINGLQAVFPDCPVKYVEYGRGIDGRLYEMHDDTYTMCSAFAISQLNRMSLEARIIIDWS